MLLDDFSVIEYKDEDISQDDLRTVLHMFSGIVQEVIRPKIKKKTIMEKYFSKNKLSQNGSEDEILAREAIEHDLYQQHEHLQDEEIKLVEEKINRKHFIHQNPLTENKQTVEEKTEDSNIQPYQKENVPENQGFEEENLETMKPKIEETKIVMWDEDESSEQNETAKQETEKVEFVEEQKDLETNLATETSWIADAPITENSGTAKQETEEDFPFQTNIKEENKETVKQEAEEEDFPFQTTIKKEETPIPEFSREETKATSPLPEFDITKPAEASPVVESIEEDLQEVISDLDVGLPATEENKAASDLKELAEQLKAVIKKEHLEEEYQETTTLAVQADNIEQLIETAERLIIEKKYDEAKNVYQEILGTYNTYDEEKKHSYFDKIQLLYNLLAHK